MTGISGGSTLSRLLWGRARRDGRRVRVGDEDRPHDEASAYAVQRGAVEASGYEVVGYKIGATAQVAMDLLGVSGPFFGPLCREAFQEDDANRRAPDGTHSRHRSGICGGLGGRPSTPRRAMDARRRGSGGRLGGAGVRDRRARASKAVSPAPACSPSPTVAPTSTSYAVRPARSGATRTSPPIPVTLRINGVEVASGHSGMLVFGDPVAGVAWLANHPELGPRGLKAGDVVTTGTCTGITFLSPGDEAEADYGALGVVRARFSG